ncbi:imidazole glycerol phosphate synthase subunit HisH [Bradyrhizobium sp. Leaf396]|nr:imidazole glycerol phosphate synthase subunit HisH [Bradyrhizobium sp. Leaf396]
MTRKVTLLDYGMCNMLNVARALEHVGADVVVTKDPKVAIAAERLVVPGVGAFSECMRAVNELGLGDAIRTFLGSERPMLGICVGMQILFEASEEFGETVGLGILPGRVRKISSTTRTGEPQRVPHIGWNHLIEPETGRSWDNTLLRPFASRAPAVYFVHSFAAQPARDSDRLADCDYGGHRISAMVKRNNVTATQFHPERSGIVGLGMLEEYLLQ